MFARCLTGSKIDEVLQLRGRPKGVEADRANTAEATFSYAGPTYLFLALHAACFIPLVRQIRVESKRARRNLRSPCWNGNERVDWLQEKKRELRVMMRTRLVSWRCVELEWYMVKYIGKTLK